jgi:hypothetical protein
MKMILKRKVKASPEDTARSIAATLARLKDRNTVLLATVPSSKPGKPPYRIVLGTNNAVWCECNGYKFRSACRHLKRFRLEIKPVVFK